MVATGRDWYLLPVGLDEHQKGSNSAKKQADRVGLTRELSPQSAAAFVRQMPSQNDLHCEQVGLVGEAFEMSISGTPLGVRRFELDMTNITLFFSKCQLLKKGITYVYFLPIKAYSTYTV